MGFDILSEGTIYFLYPMAKQKVKMKNKFQLLTIFLRLDIFSMTIMGKLLWLILGKYFFKNLSLLSKINF